MRAAVEEGKANLMISEAKSLVKPVEITATAKVANISAGAKVLTAKSEMQTPGMKATVKV